MKLAPTFRCPTHWILCCALLCLAMPQQIKAEAPPAAVSAFSSYIVSVEARLLRQHHSPPAFLDSIPPDREADLRRGDAIIEQIVPPSGTAAPGAMLHHWRGTAFAQGAKAADLERLLRDFKAYPQYFAPEVVRAKATTLPDGHVQASLRIRQQHVITVVMDIDYDVSFGRLDAQHGYSTSRSTRIAEIDSPGTRSERELPASEEHGFFWRSNNYWSYEERDGGLYMQIESVTLTRSIPNGLAWAVRPFVESVPRESLDFTLRSACNAVRK